MELLTSLVVSQGPIHRRWPATIVSAAAHALSVATAILLPILVSQPLPDLDAATGSLRLFLYDPPPPPPLPLPRGSGLVERARPAPSRPAEPETAIEAPHPEMTAAVPAIQREEAADEAGGSPTGSLAGVPEGMEGGVEGGMVGGVPGGVIGGVIGGTGTGPVVPVLDYDEGPRLLRQRRPEYPHEAFRKKVEGVVVVEILIDESGCVARTRIVQSVPLLDDAALDAVRQWIFLPAVRRGRRVATIAVAPVHFRIY